MATEQVFNWEPAFQRHPTENFKITVKVHSFPFTRIQCGLITINVQTSGYVFTEFAFILVKYAGSVSCGGIHRRKCWNAAKDIETMKRK